MSRGIPDRKLTDREAILMRVAWSLNHAQRYPVTPPTWGCYVVRATPETTRPGALVLCETSGFHPHTIARLVEWRGESDALLSALGNEAHLCKMSNEGFVEIRGIDEEALLTGWKRRAYRLFHAACTDRFHRPEHVRFDGKTMIAKVRANATIRDRGYGTDHHTVAVTYEVRIPINSRTRLRDIKAVLLAAGYGTREFEYVATPKASDGSGGAP